MTPHRTRARTRPPAVPEPAAATRRQELASLLEARVIGFEELRREFAVPARALEDDLRHLRRSLEARGQDLVVEPAACEACGFVFRDRDARHLRAPSRCPRCREERVAEPRFHVEAGRRGGR